MCSLRFWHRSERENIWNGWNFVWVVVQKSRVAPVTDGNWKIVTGSEQQQSFCLRSSDCSTGFYCFACLAGGVSEWQPKCTRTLATPTSAFPKVCALTSNPGVLHISYLNVPNLSVDSQFCEGAGNSLPRLKPIFEGKRTPSATPNDCTNIEVYV